MTVRNKAMNNPYFNMWCFIHISVLFKFTESLLTVGLACSRPSVGVAVRRAAAKQGKNEEGLGREDAPRPPSLPLSHLVSLAFSFAAVFVRYHQLRAWNRLPWTFDINLFS